MLPASAVHLGKPKNKSKTVRWKERVWRVGRYEGAVPFSEESNNPHALQGTHGKCNLALKLVFLIKPGPLPVNTSTLTDIMGCPSSGPACLVLLQSCLFHSGRHRWQLSQWTHGREPPQYGPRQDVQYSLTYLSLSSSSYADELLFMSGINLPRWGGLLCVFIWFILVYRHTVRGLKQMHIICVERFSLVLSLSSFYFSLFCTWDRIIVLSEMNVDNHCALSYQDN